MVLDRDVSIFLNFHKQIYEKLKKGFEQRETKYLIETLKPYKDIENFYYVLFGFGSLLLPLSVVVSSYYRVTYPDKARELSLNLQELELIKNITIILQNLEENIKKFKLLIKEEKEKKHNPYLLLPSLIEPYLKDISTLNSDKEKLETIKKVVEKIKNDKKIMEQIEKIKSHHWVRVVEGERK